MAPDWYLARAGMSELMDAFEAEQGVTLRRDEVVTIDDVGCAKPASDLFLEAARTENLSRAQ
jgi:beta-phosphoglucomutase-like phosphatase (HAD superfamily)